ncbi:glycine betaine ABC transporter substrate-binding protein [Lactobacillus hamsteri]|nr:glycine betaine ABC transporter substrate-binding protein [Lactobacillus hamsteri]
MSKKKIWSLINLIIIIIAIIGIVIWTKKNESSQSKNAIVIGSKNFSESKIVMQIWTDALKKEGYSIETKPNISSSVVYQAIKTGQIDLYPEYTGTIASTYLNKNIIGKNADEVNDMASRGMLHKNLVTLNYAPGNDAQGIAIRTSIASKYEITTISDLQKNADKIRFVSQGEFDKREDGIPGLTKVYGKFNFKSHKVYDPSLKYQILDKDEGDITPASTTEGQLATEKYQVLKDNKKFWAAYNLVPLVREQTLKKNPKIRNILNKIDRKLTTSELQQLNKKVDVEGQSYQNVAQKWIDKNY